MAAGWTKAKREAVALVRLWQKRMALEGWHIDVEFVPKLGGDIAQINWANGYQDAKLAISEKKWSEATPEAKLRTIIHELRHLGYAPATEVLSKYVGYESLVWKAVTEAMEKVCDVDAAILAKAYRRKSG
jgi:hypothetical protein